MSVTIRIEGIDAIVKRLDSATATATLQRAMLRSVHLLQNRMALYPSQRAGSTYVRTGTLGRRWTTAVETKGTTIRGRVGNNTSYGPFVQSKAFQASIHRGRWQTDQDVMDRSLTTIQGYFEDEIGRALDGR